MTTIFIDTDLAALAGADLDILFRGVDLLSDSHIYHIYIHITTASIIIIVSRSHYTQNRILCACVFTNILSM